jgi:hypothetical protein
VPQTKGYQYPDPINPGSLICIKVLVPNDLLYIAAFWRSYEYFTSPIAWQQGDLPTIKDVAAIWSEAFNIARAQWEAGIRCEEEVMAFDMRVKPGMPWVTQVSTDGGATWHDAIIQPHWEVTSQTITLSDDPNAAADLGAQIFRWLEGIVININTDITNNIPQAETIANIMDSLSDYGAGATLQPTVQSLYDNILADAGEAETWGTDCPFTDPFAYLKGAIEGAGANLFLQLSQALEGLQTQTTSAIGGDLFNLASLLGAAAVRDIAQSTNPLVSGVDFGVDCFSEFTDGADTYRLYGPWIATIVSPPGDQNTGYLAQFNLPADEEIVAFHGRVEDINTVLGFYAASIGTGVSVPPDLFNLVSAGFSFIVNTFPPPDPIIGATRKTGEPSTLYASAGLDEPTAINQGGLASFTGPHPLGAFMMEWGDTANNVSEATLTVHVITKLV